MTALQGSDEFDSAWLKWSRAIEHAQALDADVMATTKDPNHIPVLLAHADYDNKRHGFPIRVGTAAPIPKAWNLMLGDLAHNFRCSLDHLAWALVQCGRKAGSLSERELRHVSFPIAKSRLDFKAATNSRLPGVRRADLAILRRYQPYIKGETRVQWHCFRVLDDLVKFDKHREIQDIWWRPVDADYEVAHQKDCVPLRIKVWRNRLARVDTELAFVYVRKTGPEPSIQMGYSFASYQPAFHERLRLNEWCQIAAMTTMKLLGEFADAPDAALAVIEQGWFNRAIAAWGKADAAWDAVGSGTASRDERP